MKVLVIGNLTDTRCGFQNFTVQTITALRRAGHEVRQYDGTYTQVYARQQDPQTHPYSFLPPDAVDMDVIHVVWHPATLNHYNGADWVGMRERAHRPVLSVWNGCPAAWCPFTDLMDVRWGVLGREEGHRQIWYPIPDWVEDLPEPDPQFTVGYSGVRKDGLAHILGICTHHGWAVNASDPAVWLSQEDEIRRLARSSVNVCWYSGEHDDRSGGAMVCLASKRPLLCNDVRMMLHLKPYSGTDVMLCENDPAILRAQLEQAAERWAARRETHFPLPTQVLADFSWSKAVNVLEEGWNACRNR